MGQREAFGWEDRDYDLVLLADEVERMREQGVRVSNLSSSAIVTCDQNGNITVSDLQNQIVS